MSSNQKKIILFALLFIGSGFLFKLYVDVKKPSMTREHYNSEYNQQASKNAKEEKSNKNLGETKEVVVQDESTFSMISPSELNSILQRIDKDTQKRSRACEKWLSKYLIDDEYIDVNSHMYQDKDSALWLFHESFSKVLMRKSADEGYVSLENIINSNPKIDPIDYYTKLESLDICRFPKILNFIDTLIEASAQLQWSQEDQKSIITTVLDIGLIENNPSMEGMLFQLNMVRVLVESKLIPQALGEEINFLVNRLQEHEVTFRKGFGARFSNEENRSSLRDFLSLNRELWHDVKELMERTKYNLSL